MRLSVVLNINRYAIQDLSWSKLLTKTMFKKVELGSGSGGFLAPQIPPEKAEHEIASRSSTVEYNIPRIVLSMDAEDSPWGGTQFLEDS
jgi:hypothetical protein